MECKVPGFEVEIDEDFDEDFVCEAVEFDDWELRRRHGPGEGCAGDDGNETRLC